MNPYDAMPYPGGAFARSHPSHVAAVARLFGVPAADPARCRLLEIGCNEGRNLLPMAAVLPEATFVGIDPAEAPIAVAEARRREAGLDNVALHAVGVEALDASWGTFDYVVCHGVWSWVGPDVREAIFALCARALAPGGVAYVSYNTLPGWYMHMPARDLMRRHAAGFADPVEQVTQARAVLELLRDGSASLLPSYAHAARDAATTVMGRQDGYLFHDHLSTFHEPVYFSDFVGAASRAGLRYLADAELATMFDHDLPAAGRTGLAVLGAELMAREQLLDFLRGRAFRASLLVKEGTPVSRRWNADRLAGLWLRSPLVADADGHIRHRDQVVQVGDPPPEPLARLLAAAPAALPSETVARSPAEATLVLDLVSRGFVEVLACPPPWSADPGDHPATTALARAEARAGDVVVALDHTSVRLDDEQRAAVASADGRTPLPRKIVGPLTRACLWRAPTSGRRPEP